MTQDEYPDTDADECKANRYGGPEDCGCYRCREQTAEEGSYEV
ncbi:hypothetical protein [Streptomyces atroolivaceus]